jgi:hypothetical protein
MQSGSSPSANRSAVTRTDSQPPGNNPESSAREASPRKGLKSQRDDCFAAFVRVTPTVQPCGWAADGQSGSSPRWPRKASSSALVLDLIRRTESQVLRRGTGLDGLSPIYLDYPSWSYNSASENGGGLHTSRLQPVSH